MPGLHAAGSAEKAVCRLPVMRNPGLHKIQGVLFLPSMRRMALWADREISNIHRRSGDEANNSHMAGEGRKTGG